MNAREVMENKTTEVAAKRMKKNRTLKEWIQIMEPEIKKALPSVITPDRFTRMATTALSVSSELSKCTYQSFVGALMNAAQLGLEPNTPLGQAYIIPYKRTKKDGTEEYEAQFQIGYKGLIDLAHRSGEFKTIYAHAVYENDEFEYELGLDQALKHKPAKKDRGKAIYYYAVYHLTNGGYGFYVMSKDDIEEHKRRFSKAASRGFSPWSTDFDEMAKKTVIKKLLKYAPIKTEFARQIVNDESIKTEIDSDMAAVEDKMQYEEATFTEVTKTIEADVVETQPEA